MTATCLEAMLKVHHPYPHSPAHLPWPSQLSPGRTGLTGAALSRGSFITRAHAVVAWRSQEEGYLYERHGAGLSCSARPRRKTPRASYYKLFEACAPRYRAENQVKRNKTETVSQGLA